jgi:probable addiction module antidote protein
VECPIFHGFVLLLEELYNLILALSTLNANIASPFSQIANAAGLGRESLYKAFSKGSKPRFDTVMKVMAAIGVKLHASA